MTEQYLLEMIDRSRWRKPQEDFHQVPFVSLSHMLNQSLCRAAWVPHQRDIALENLQESILKCIQEEIIVRGSFELNSV